MNNINGSEKFQIFEEWLLDNGSKFPKVELKDYGNDVRGCHSTSEITTDEIVVEIPLKCLITVEMGKDTDIGQMILHADIELDAPKHIFLMLFMLIDKKDPNSFFKPYYDILPKTLSNMPIFWNEEELSYLKGSFVLTQIDERNLAIEKDYDAICAIAPQFKSISTLDEFKWARMAVCSRNFGIVVHGLRTAALVPYADMLNHFRPRETKWNFDDSINGFIVSAIHMISPGGQIFDSYGQKCNHRFLLNYGFSVENNEEIDGYNPNEVPILLNLDEEDVLFHQKLVIWKRECGSYSRRIRVNLSDCDNTRLAFSLIRVIVANNDEVSSILGTSSNNPYRVRGYYPSMLNSNNERNTLNYMNDLCDDYLSRYPTSLGQDIADLSSSKLPLYSNQRNAVIQVKGEKEILHCLKRLVTVALHLLNIYAQEEVASYLSTVKANEHAFIHQYCESVALRIWKKEFDSSRSVGDRKFRINGNE